MILRKADFIFYIVNNISNTIYNKITDPDNGNSVYPDILFEHDFEEAELSDHKIYNEASRLMSEYKSAHCVFLSCKDSVPEALENAVLSTRAAHSEPFDETQVRRFCHELSLSVTMESNLKKLFEYYSYHGVVSELISRIYTEFSLPVPKTEGKKIYEHIRKIILQ